MKNAKLASILALGIAAAAAPIAPVTQAQAQSLSLATSSSGLTPKDAEAVWRLRSGLNVAALSCKAGQHEDVAPSYSQLLDRHKALLSAAYDAETQRHGARAFDRSQTRTYNQFSLQKSPAQFCQTAAEVAQQSVAMDSAGLSSNASQLVAKLERELM